MLDEETTHKIVNGIIDPITHKRFEESNNDKVMKLFGFGKENKRLSDGDYNKSMYKSEESSSINSNNNNIHRKDELQNQYNNEEIEEINAVITLSNNDNVNKIVHEDIAINDDYEINNINEICSNYSKINTKRFASQLSQSNSSQKMSQTSQNQLKRKHYISHIF